MATQTRGNEVSLLQAKDAIIRAFYGGMMPMLHGSPGIGKSALLEEIADELNLKLLDFRLAQADPTDLNGFPGMNADKTRARYIPFENFPLEGDPLPTETRVDSNGKTYTHKFDGWLLFFDELNGADRDVQKAAYKPLYDRFIGNNKIHERCVMAGAGNLASDNAAVEELSTALQSRMTHLVVRLDYKEWLDWASKKDVDFRVRAFIRFKPDLLFNFKPDHDDFTFACPRTWAKASNVITGKESVDVVDRALLMGNVGIGVGREFAGFCSIKDDLPSLADIERDPENARISEEPSIRWALSGMLSTNMNHNNADPLVTYLKRLPKEFQVFALRDVVRKDETMWEHDAVQGWVADVGTALVS